LWEQRLLAARKRMSEARASSLPTPVARLESRRSRQQAPD
jgi:hypothetical protein